MNVNIYSIALTYAAQFMDCNEHSLIDVIACDGLDQLIKSSVGHEVRLRSRPRYVQSTTPIRNIVSNNVAVLASQIVIMGVLIFWSFVPEQPTPRAPLRPGPRTHFCVECMIMSLL